MNKLKFSIVIPTFNRLNDLCRCLDSLTLYVNSNCDLSNQFDVEIVVSDDARDPDLEKVLALKYPRTRYTSGPGQGPAANRNHGASVASGNWLVFTDDDCIPQPGWLEAFAEHAGRFDVLEGRTIASGKRNRIDQEAPINETGGHLWSCNFAIRRDLFFQMSGFNDSFPAPAMEDVEFSLRVNKLGVRRSFVHAATVAHPWRARKGAAFVRQYATSVAYFTSIHHENAKAFAPHTLLLNWLRCTKRNVFYSFRHSIYRGLARQLALDAYAQYAIWRAVSAVN